MWTEKSQNTREQIKKGYICHINDEPFNPLPDFSEYICVPEGLWAGGMGVADPRDILAAGSVLHGKRGLSKIAPSYKQFTFEVTYQGKKSSLSWFS